MMVPLTFLATFETIGSIVGILITLITFFTLITKRPLKAFRNMIREESKAANSDLKEQIEKVDQKIDKTNEHIGQIDEKIADNDQTDLAILRNTITHIYYKYKDDKRIPHYEKENVMYLYERYRKKKGNSYVKTIMKEIETWEEII